MPCPECGGNTRTVWGALNEPPVHQECLGVVIRQGMRKRKDGTERFCRIRGDPCGWSTGKRPSNDFTTAREPPERIRLGWTGGADEGETPEDGHTSPTGRLVLSDYRAG